MKFKHIVIMPTGLGTVRVAEDYVYRDVLVHKGFESDGATIPRVLWSVFPPFYPNYLTASTVHDYLCQAKMYAKADRYFDEILRLSTVSTATRLILVAGVKSWHKIAYKKSNEPRFWLRIINKFKG